ncbi:hypothetical protein HY29_04015 [Hyphomonas beringensis]|uniref:Uncharacterized protein n=1 Tax=Hyphomonas beringensis TaxID=1280946 RepID=A0A062U518_9PROT|nr:hypothetical protein [Hyphomonas beringensis]KCZ53397.1 hypothetical protein HY29_04015 [Hyphomonas beringensis]
MQTQLQILGVSAVAALLAGTCFAQPGSDATATVRIVVPPLAEALEAQEAGASGVWTAMSQDRGFMVGVTPSSAEAVDTTGQLAVFAGALSRVHVEFGNAGQMTRLQGQVADSDGALKHYVFDLPGSDTHNMTDKTQLLFSTI